MSINCPICTKENKLSDDVKTCVPVVQTCDFCKFGIYICRKASGDLYTEDAEWREISLNFYGKEITFKKQLEEIEGALFVRHDTLSEKYKYLGDKTLLKMQEELNVQFDLLNAERKEKYEKFQERWSRWSEKYRNQ